MSGLNFKKQVTLASNTSKSTWTLTSHVITNCCHSSNGGCLKTTLTVVTTRTSFFLTTVASHFPSARLTYKTQTCNIQRLCFTWRVSASRIKISAACADYKGGTSCHSLNLNRCTATVTATSVGCVRLAYKPEWCGARVALRTHIVSTHTLYYTFQRSNI